MKEIIILPEELTEEGRAEIAALEPYRCGCQRQVVAYNGRISLRLTCVVHRVMVGSSRDAIASAIDKMTDGIIEATEELKQRKREREAKRDEP